MLRRSGTAGSGPVRPDPRRRRRTARVVDDIFLCLRGVCYDWCSRNGAYDLEARMLECLELLLPGLRPGAGER